MYSNSLTSSAWLAKQRRDATTSSCPLIAVHECDEDTLTSSTGATTLSKSDVISPKAEADVTSFKLFNGTAAARDSRPKLLLDAHSEASGSSKHDSNTTQLQNKTPADDVMATGSCELTDERERLSPCLLADDNAGARTQVGGLKRGNRRSFPSSRSKARASFSVASTQRSQRRTLSFKDERIPTSQSHNLLGVTSRPSVSRRASLTPSLKKLQVRFAAQIEVSVNYKVPFLPQTPSPLAPLSTSSLPSRLSRSRKLLSESDAPELFILS